MLHLYKLKKKINFPRLKYNSGNLVGKLRNTMPVNKEWFNSVYAFNKNNVNLLPVADNIVAKLLKSYFSMLKIKNKGTKYKRIAIFSKYREMHRVWISKPDIKHINDKLVITLRIYNRQYNYIVNKLPLAKWLYQYSLKMKKFFDTKKKYLNEDLHVYNFIKSCYWTLKAEMFAKLRTSVVKNFIFDPTLKQFIDEKKHFDKETIENLRKQSQEGLKNLETELNNYVKTKRDIVYNLKEDLNFNKVLFNKQYLEKLKKMFKNFYGKDIEINIISLSNYYFDSNILSQIVTTKIRKRENKALKVIKRAIRGVYTPILNDRTVERELMKLTEETQNLIVRNKNDFLNTYITTKGVKGFKNKILKKAAVKGVKESKNKQVLEMAVLKSTKDKVISGITLKASGRITRRIIAERARYNITSVGTLKNVNSSYKGLSSSMVRGYKKSNIDSTLMKSKTHVGAFGIKGWISSF